MKLVASAVGFMMIACMGTSATTSPAAQCRANDSAVIEATLQHEVARDVWLKPGQVLVMYDTTVQPRRNDIGDITKYITGPAARSLAERNANTTTLIDAPDVERVTFVRQQELRRLFPQPAHDPQEAWKEFYEQFPAGAGLVNVSLPGYDERGCQALLYVERQGGPLAAEGFIVRLAWRDGRWTVVERQRQWVS